MIDFLKVDSEPAHSTPMRFPNAGRNPLPEVREGDHRHRDTARPGRSGGASGPRPGKARSTGERVSAGDEERSGGSRREV